MKNYLLASFLLVLCSFAFAQKEASYWYFGQNAGVQFDFERNTVTALTDGSLNTLEGCTSISDRDGGLLFYSDGSTIWNRNHQVMQNGTGLKGDESSTSSGLIVPKPQDPNFYYLFTVDEPHHNNSSAFPNNSDGDGVNNGLMYSRININDDGGLGAVDSDEKNVPLVTYDTSNPLQVEFKSSEKITAVRADDCSSFWVISHFVDTFYAFKIDENGVSTTAVTSKVGPEVPVEGYRRNALGYLKASPDGTKLVAAHFGFATEFSGNAGGGVYLFDFDNDTGTVSNSIELYSPQNNSSPYGVEFSAESRKVYASVGQGASGGGTSEIWQWDLESGNIPESGVIVHTSNTISAGALQLAINKKIYRAQLNFNNFQNARYLGVIENPEAPGSSVIYNEQGILLDVNNNFQNLSRIGLPPFIQSLFNSQIDIIRNGESSTELRLCEGDSYVLSANEISGADYVWFKDGATLAETSFELEVDEPGLYELFIEPNNGECPIEGTAIVGVFEIPIANSTNDIFVCDDDNDGQVSFDFITQSIEILGSQDPDTFQVSYFGSEQNAITGLNQITLPFVNSQSQQTIYARIDNIGNPGCFDITSFEISVFGTPVLNNLEFEVCDDFGDISDGIANIDLNLFIEEINRDQPGFDVDVSFHGSQNEAEQDLNPLPLNYTNTSPNTETIYVRAENSDFTSCYEVAELSIIINPAPVVIDVSIFQCDEDGNPNGITQFNLTEVAADISDNQPNRQVNFYEDLSDAVQDIDPIDGTNYLNVSPLQIVITRVTNTVTGCSNFGELLLEVSSTSANDALLELCDSDDVEDGFIEFDLSLANDQVLEGLPTGLNIDYYATYEDALLESNVLPINYTNTLAYNDIVFARVENANACYGISELELMVLTLPNIETEFETVYCLNEFPDTITLTGGVIDDLPSTYLYEWSTGEITSEIQINQAGTYTVDVFNTLGCSKRRTIIVAPSNTATIENIQVTDVSENNSISFSVSGEGDYEFSLTSIEGPYQDEPFFSNLPPDLYTLYVRDKNGCGVIDQDISVIGFPKFFSPNGDGVNDVWQIKGLSSRNQLEGNINIFDRYGKLIISLDPSGPGWTGDYNGSKLPASDYWFTATLGDGRSFTSHFSLKR
ncbi:T9SS type B sorting domain-containing protein [Winogradskyella aurantiaca]|uniref:T9SS type B sorting domain-containing protein n=1 Tax=Winogradskyella aurantiaca TaxID=2219558 RepID=UPI000E1C77C2|nr:T9SS type B sorting domain-containing protein [Winogradskyella aurantiaca]